MIHDPRQVEEGAEEAAAALRRELGAPPRLALVLGSGWDRLAAGYEEVAGVGFDDVPGLSVPGAEGHRGRISVVKTPGGELLVQHGRLHLYEGLSALDVSFPVWAYHAWGVGTVLFFNAAGGLNPTYMPGDLMVVGDHINLAGVSPLTGVPQREGRPRHYAPLGLYHAGLQGSLKGSLPAGTRCETGVYAFVPGPSFETRAEAVMLRVMGADAVGMSTAPEALAAGFLGMRVAAMSCISNTLLPAGPAPSHRDVLERVRATVDSLGEYAVTLASLVSMVV